MSVRGFYEDIESIYHLVYPDWETSIERQGDQIQNIIQAAWGSGFEKILDVTCGIGTQSLGLARRGYQVRGSDIAPGAIARAGREATERGLSIDFSICDVRKAHDHHGSGFDLVISCDNSLPHLLSDREIELALEQMHACLRPDGGCLITLRDYDSEERGKGIFKPFGTRDVSGRRFAVFQIWDFDGDHYDLSMYFMEDGDPPRVRVSRTKYYAIGVERMGTLMEKMGFRDVRRLDGVFFQPVLVGTRS